ncbi:hypothetical protein M413DRAFT_448258 [Hebeloma cylindrosporum]|uniref:Uncharacterized protein n=1 Tax=Hebeloma cylindrosporum TaxID=76867 RepID=A0A0C3C292_HEBCY|nr:hypothetical protein M413DRAFT_448258 [Hebeloma cylindrosporum h7]
MVRRTEEAFQFLGTRLCLNSISQISPASESIPQARQRAVDSVCMAVDERGKERKDIVSWVSDIDAELLWHEFSSR